MKPENTPDSIVQGGEVIPRPEAEYTFLYGIHYSGTIARTITEEADGLFIEAITSEPWTKNSEEKINYWATGDYSALFKTFAERQKPIFMYDVSMSIPVALTAMTAEAAIGAGEVVAGSKILKDMYDKSKVEKHLEKKEYITRRRFSKAALKLGLGLASAWLLSPALSTTARLLSGVASGGDAVSAEALRLSESLHPEQNPFVLKFRNNIWAHKQWWLATQVYNHPSWVSIGGVNHVGFKNAIEMEPEKRLDNLKADHKLFGGLIYPETFYTVMKFDHNGSLWQPNEKWEIPELKEIALQNNSQTLKE